MKQIVLVLINLFLTTICYSQTKINIASNVPDSSLKSIHFISLSEVEKILEQPSHVKDSTWYYEGGTWKFKNKFLANSPKDSITKIKAELFFAFEQFKQDSEAKTFFEYSKNENSKSAPITNLNQTGDEAFLVKDKLNNPFILIRKNKNIYKLKLYNVNSTNSTNELLLIAKKISSLPE